MNKSREREALIGLLNQIARDAWEGYRNAKTELMLCVMRKRQVVGILKEFGISSDEIKDFTDINIVVREAEEPTQDDGTLIERANDLIDAQYNRGKYEGREAVGLLRQLFTKIGEETLQKFDDSRS